MIQRIQSAYIGLAIICMMFVYVMPFSKYTPELNKEQQEQLQSVMGFSTYVSGIEFFLQVNAETEITEDQQKDLEKGVVKANEELDKELEKADVKFLFTAAMIWNAFVILLIVLMLLAYKRRKRQIIIGMICSAILLFYVAGLVIASNFGLELLQERFSNLTGGRSDLPWNVSLGLGTYLPIAAMVFIALAIFKIKKDQKLIDSVDRIR